MNWDARGLRGALPHISDLDKYRIRNMNAKLFIKEEQRAGWSGKLPFYVFWCPDCENFSYDYPHSYIGSRYLLCHRCSARIDFRPWWVEWKILFSFIKESLAVRWGGNK